MSMTDPVSEYLL